MKSVCTLLCVLASILFLFALSCGDDDDDDNDTAASDDDAEDDDDTTDDDDTADDDDDTVDPRFQEVLDYMEAEFDEYQVPGGAIAIVVDGQIAFTGAIGVKEADGKGDPVTPDTAFTICSVSKMLTSAGIMTLWDEKAFDLDAPVTDYVPFFDLADPHDPASVSTHQLLTHSAGMPDYLEQNCDTGDGALSDWIEDNGDFPLWSPPGRLWNYSNLGYSVAGAVLEQVSGDYFPEAMQARVFGPAGMSGMTYYPEEAMAGDHATGHSLRASGNLATFDLDYYNCASGWPPGLLYGNVKGLAKFAEAMLADGGDVMTKAAADQMKTPHVETHYIPGNYYGYGLMLATYKSLNMITHDGGITGFRTTWWIAPEENFGVVVFINADYYEPAYIAFKALDVFLEPEEDEPQDFSTPQEEWAKYTGTYNDPYEYGPIVVHQDEDLDMFVLLPNWSYETELIQYAVDTFVFDITGDGYYLPVTFFLDDEDQGEYFATRAGVGVRVEEKGANPGAGQMGMTYDEWVARAMPFTTQSPDDHPVF